MEQIITDQTGIRTWASESLAIYLLNSYSLDHLEVSVLYAEVFTLYQQYSALFLLFLTFIYFV